MKLKTARCIFLILLISWMCVIFCFSSENAAASTDTSNSVIVKVVEYVYPEYHKLPAQKKQEVINRFSLPVRKLAHFSEFFILGALAFAFFYTFKNIYPKLKVVFTLLWGILYAISDEIHQIFVSGRACRFFDILIDSAGVALAVLLGYLILFGGGKNERKGHKKRLFS